MTRNPDLNRTLFYIAALVFTICIHGPMAAMSIGAGVVFAAWILLRRTKTASDIVTWKSSPIFLPTLALTAACLLSLLWADLSGFTFYGEKPRVDWIQDTRKLWHLFFPFALASVFAALDKKQFRTVTLVWLGMGLATAILGVVQHYVPIYHPMVLPHMNNPEFVHVDRSGFFAMFLGDYHATGLTGFHLSYVSLLAFPTGAWAALALSNYQKEGLNRRTGLAIAAFLFFFLANMFSFSKIAWAALPLTLVLVAGIETRGKKRYAIFGVLLLAMLAWVSSDSFRLRFMGTGTIAQRMEVWHANLAMIREHPILGIGWQKNSQLAHGYYKAHGTTGFESHGHNNFIDQWATIGLAGLAAFLWLNLNLMKMGLRLYRENPERLWKTMGLGLFAGMVCLHLNGLTQANWWDAKVLHQIGWVTAFLMVAYRNLKPKKSRV